MQQQAIVNIIRELDAHRSEKELAMILKREFDREFFPTWHCVVGKNFGSFVSYEEKHMLYFQVGQFSVLLWRAG